jgi:LAO/AO transport system kinase
MTIAEEARPGADQILSMAHAESGSAWVIGITGPPGAGKSTLTDMLITRLRSGRARVAVAAIDPSSPFTGGAILGDRVRMQSHALDDGVFVRSMASRGRLGGVADATAKVVTIFDALGFDPVIVETVGVGQSEVDVMEVCDTVVVVLTPGMGDGVQASKAGVLEVADILVVNKSDQPGAGDVVRELTQMLELGSRGEWVPPILSTEATIGSGVEELLTSITDHQTFLSDPVRRGSARRRRLEATVRRAALASWAEKLGRQGIDDDVMDDVVAGNVDPWTAGAGLID